MSAPFTFALQCVTMHIELREALHSIPGGSMGVSYREELRRHKTRSGYYARPLGHEATARVAAGRAFWSKTEKVREKARQAGQIRMLSA